MTGNSDFGGPMAFQFGLIPTHWVRLCLKLFTVNRDGTANRYSVMLGGYLLRLAPETAVIEICNKLRDSPTQLNQHLLVYALYQVAPHLQRTGLVFARCIDEWTNLNVCPTPPHAIMRPLVNLVELVQLDRSSRAAVLYKLNRGWPDFNSITAPVLARCLDEDNPLIGMLLLDLEGPMVTTLEQQAAARALAHLKRISPHRFNALARAVTAEDNSVRRHIVIALAKMKFERAAEKVFSRRINDHSFEVRLAAAEGLQHLRDCSSLDLNLVKETAKSGPAPLPDLYLEIRYLMSEKTEAIPELLEDLARDVNGPNLLIAALWHLWEGAPTAAFQRQLARNLEALLTRLERVSDESTLYLAELIAHARAEGAVLAALSDHKKYRGLELFGVQVLSAMLNENPLFLVQLLRLTTSEDEWIRGVAAQTLMTSADQIRRFESLRNLSTASEMSRLLETYRLLSA